MEHWDRFRELATTQLFAVDKELPLELFKEWMLDAKVDKNCKMIKKSVIYFEKDRSENDIIEIQATHHEHLPKRELEVVRGVPTGEIELMIDLASQYVD